MRIRYSCLLIFVVLFFPATTPAVLFRSTGDVAYNTTAPGGALAGSGWQFQGEFRQYLGTPVSAHHFITAGHVGGAIGETFIFDGQDYVITAKKPDPGSDLVLYEVDGTFPRYAPLYSTGDEVNKSCVVLGRGTQRGTAVYANGDLKGWTWGPTDGVMRWGENKVDSVTTANGYPVLLADFDSTGGVGANECMLSDKDSGGAMFIKENGVWKLAGINYAIHPKTFSTSSSGANSFTAALFDYSFRPPDSEKLYYDSGASPWPYFNDPGNDPCRFYVTRISSRYTWISSNIPEFDRDVDGLPDWWEILHAGDATSMDALGHSDSDSFTNYEEWISDTDPTDGNSFLQLGAYTNAASLVFSSSINRKYQVQYRLNLTDTNEIWATELDWFAGAAFQSEKSVSQTTSNRFYRIRAKLR